MLINNSTIQLRCFLSILIPFAIKLINIVEIPSIYTVFVLATLSVIVSRNKTSKLESKGSC